LASFATFPQLLCLIQPVNHQNEENRADRALVEQVLRGDRQAFKTLIHNTDGLVAQIVFKMIGKDADRRDIAQDVYLKVYQSLSRFRFQSKLSTWICQITYNTCINYLRKKKFIVDDYDFEDERSGISKNTSDVFSNETEKMVFNRELSNILRIEMDNLPPVYRTLITLYHQEDMSYAEIGQITGLPDGTVKSYLFRARKALKDKLCQTYKKEAL
jgi:RNA polymerase sigma factor (sigma-70 family)